MTTTKQKPAGANGGTSESVFAAELNTSEFTASIANSQVSTGPAQTVRQVYYALTVRHLIDKNETDLALLRVAEESERELTTRSAQTYGGGRS